MEFPLISDKIAVNAAKALDNLNKSKDAYDKENKRLKIPQGIIQGCTGKNLDGEIFYEFFGVPYAKPPLGDLRFKAPLPAENWSGVRDATKEYQICYSTNEFSEKPEGSEDCLFLNIYTKQLPSEGSQSSKPVMVWLHGGAFLRGSNSPRLYGPEFLLTEDIVLVTVQYRLGALGYLRLKDPSLEIYGNAGLKDQSLALKYIKENIPYFGGDPDNVTIFGTSAGGTSVGNHILSPLSKGLFHKAIIQSGSAIKGWDECIHNPEEMAQTVDKNVTSEKKALSIFRKLPVEKLFGIQVKYVKNKELNTVNKQFGPVVEDLNSKFTFISKNPIDIVLSGNYNHVPIMTGYNDKEGMLFDYYRMMNPKRIMTVDSAIPHFFNLARGSKERKELEEKIKKFYFVNGDYHDNLRDLLGDVGYITPCYATALNHSRTSKYPVYLYRCTLDTSINYLKNKLNLSHLPGTSHFDEASYLFNNVKTTKKLKLGLLTSLEEKSIRTMVKLWTNFAKYGNPTPNNALGFTWKPFTDEEHNFLNIGNEIYSGVRPDSNRMDFWADIYRNYSATNRFL